MWLGTFAIAAENNGSWDGLIEISRSGSTRPPAAGRPPRASPSFMFDPVEVAKCSRRISEGIQSRCGNAFAAPVAGRHVERDAAARDAFTEGFQRGIQERRPRDGGSAGTRRTARPSRHHGSLYVTALPDNMSAGAARGRTPWNPVRRCYSLSYATDDGSALGRGLDLARNTQHR